MSSLVIAYDIVDYNLYYKYSVLNRQNILYKVPSLVVKE